MCDQAKPDADTAIDAPCQFCGGAVQLLGDPTEDAVPVRCLNPECGLPDLRLNPTGALAAYQRAKATAQAYGYKVSSLPRTPDEAVQNFMNMIAAGELQRLGVPPGPPPHPPQPRGEAKPRLIKTVLKILGRTLLYVVVFHVLLVGSLALGRSLGLGRVPFDIVSLLLFLGLLRLFFSLFSGDPIVLARDPALWLGVAVMILLMIVR